MAKQKEKIPITKSYLPDKKEYFKYLEKIWNSRWLTNNGIFVQELERKLKDYLGVKHLFFISSGTMGLQIAIKALRLNKEIITTPFSYIATVNAIIWEKCKPVFADIDKSSFCIDPDKIERKVTKNTQAILAVHVFGNPCQTRKIEAIANKYNLKVIYDAAHAFGTCLGNKSVLEFGDISVLSFHATKTFHTGEGGAIVVSDDALAEKISSLRNFGQRGINFEEAGINGKNSEFHAALGLCLLPKMKNILDERKQLAALYDKHLSGLGLKRPRFDKKANRNYTYYPIVFKSEEDILRAVAVLENNNIFPRRYFYPSINTLNFIRGEQCPISEFISKRILCLPFYCGLDPKTVINITNLIKASVKSKNF